MVDTDGSAEVVRPTRGIDRIVVVGESDNGMVVGQRKQLIERWIARVAGPSSAVATRLQTVRNR